MDGILNLYKPAGVTSMKAVTRVKRALKLSKAGHAGTLDPAATGVLLVCIGKATKLFDTLQTHDKEYVANVRLGIETDTYDAEGRQLETRAVPALTTADIEAALDAFRGEIQQVPPMYSALKRDGQPLYKLARSGQTVERAARTVTVRELELLQMDLPHLRLRVVCTRGTYIRSLAHDLGAALGCGGHLASLERTRSGPYRSSDALPLEELEAHPDQALDRIQPL